MEDCLVQADLAPMARIRQRSALARSRARSGSPAPPPDVPLLRALTRGLRIESRSALGTMLRERNPPSLQVNCGRGSIGHPNDDPPRERPPPSYALVWTQHRAPPRHGSSWMSCRPWGGARTKGGIDGVRDRALFAYLDWRKAETLRLTKIAHEQCGSVLGCHDLAALANLEADVERGRVKFEMEGLEFEVYVLSRSSGSRSNEGVDGIHDDETVSLRVRERARLQDRVAGGLGEAIERS